MTQRREEEGNREQGFLKPHCMVSAVSAVGALAIVARSYVV